MHGFRAGAPRATLELMRRDSQSGDADRAWSKRRRRVLGVVGVTVLISVAFAVTEKLRERRAREARIRESQCEAARSRAKTEWDEFRTDLTLHHFEKTIAAQERALDAGVPAAGLAEAEKELAAIKSAQAPTRMGRADLQRLRDLAEKSPPGVERPRFAELEAALAGCEGY